MQATAIAPIIDLEQHRGFLFGLAYRLLGSAAEAEDVVQDTFVRALAAPPAEIERPRSYLATIATRVGLDRLRAARAKRETYFGEWLPEPVRLQPVEDVTTQPEDAALLEDSISLAFLVVLESLTPVERATFVLHDVFGFEYSELAGMLQRSEATCRQNAHRARERVRQRRQRFATSNEARARLTSAFLEAARSGDVTRLADLLTEDVVLVSDGGGKVAAAVKPIRGRDKVMRFMLSPKVLRYYKQIEVVEVNGGAAIAISYQGEVHTLLTFEPTLDGRAGEILAVRNPDKMRRI